MRHPSAYLYLIQNGKNVGGDEGNEFRRGDVFGEEKAGLLHALHESIERVGLRRVEGLVQISLLLHDLYQLLAALHRRADGKTCLVDGWVRRRRRREEEKRGGGRQGGREGEGRGEDERGELTLMRIQIFLQADYKKSGFLGSLLMLSMERGNNVAW